MKDAQETQKPASQVEIQLEAVNEALRCLVGRIDDLTSKLRLILIPTPPLGESKLGISDGPPLVPLAEDLQSIEERIRVETDRILSLIERCEL